MSDLHIVPEAALRPGSFDAFAVMVLWLARKSFWWLLWLGMTIAVATNHLDDFDSDFDLDSVGALADQLRSPLVVLLLAFGIRLGAAGGAMLLVYPVVRDRQAAYAYRTGVVRLIDFWFDRWQLMRAVSAFRWTYPVRAVAVQRLGTTGIWLRRLGSLCGALNVLLLVVLIVVLAVRSQSL